MVDIVLINPAYNLTVAIDDNIDPNNKRGFFTNLPHLGLGYLAGAIEVKGYKSKILDCSAEGLNNLDVIEFIKNDNPRIIGLTVTTPSLNAVFLLVNLIKKNIKNCEIIIGGPHVTIDSGIVREMDLNFGLMGEAEKSLPLFLDYYLHNKCNIDSIDGLVYRENGTYKINPPEVIKDIDSIALPARHLYNHNCYYNPHFEGNITSLLTSRGCPFSCSFCSYSTIRRNYRKRSIQNVILEIKHIVDSLNIKTIEFVDDIFTVDMKRTFDLCNEIMKNNLGFKWVCQTRPNLVSRELLEVMKKAGCSKISFGIESGSERIRKEVIGKNIPDKVIVETIKTCKELGILVATNIILGHPNETKQDIKNSIKFIIKLNPDFVLITPLCILPDSPLFNIAQREKRINSDIYNRYMRGDALFPIYEHDGIRRKFLIKMVRRGYLLFYLNPKKIIQILKSIRSFKELLHKVKVGFIIIKDFIL